MSAMLSVNEIFTFDARGGALFTPVALDEIRLDDPDDSLQSDSAAGALFHAKAITIEYKNQVLHLSEGAKSKFIGEYLGRLPDRKHIALREIYTAPKDMLTLLDVKFIKSKAPDLKVVGGLALGESDSLVELCTTSSDLDLRSLVFDGGGPQHYILLDVLERQTNLQSLKFRACEGMDEFFRSLEKDSLPQVKTMNLNSMTDLSEDAIVKIMKAMPNLEALYLKGFEHRNIWHRLEREKIELPNLRLVVFSQSNIDAANLDSLFIIAPNLEEAELSFVSDMQVFLDGDENNLPKLEKLVRADLRFLELTEAQLRKLFKIAPDLREINLSPYMRRYGNDLAGIEKEFEYITFI